MRVLILFVFCVMCVMVRGRTELKEVFTWKQIDFNFNDENERQDAIAEKEFIVDHNVPVGLEVWREKVFVTIPRWKNGVPASLAYINKKDRSDSPLLIPYPNWEAHNQNSTNPNRIVSPFRIRADSCNRLWIMDTGTSDVLGNGDVLSPPQVIVYDLLTDKLLRNFTLPASQTTNTSFFANIAVDVLDCTKTWAYLADLGGPGLVVYDWEKNSSWLIKNDYFKYDKISENYNVSGTNFTWTDGIFGVALTELDPQTKQRTLYFHAFSSYNEYQVSTKVLRNEEMSKNARKGDFVKVGTRGDMTQSGSSFVSEKDGVLLYAQVNLDSVGCWNYRHQTDYVPATLDVVALDKVKLVFPNDVKVDADNNLWVLTDRMQEFVYSSLDANKVNFRILKGSVQDLIKDTKCDAKYTQLITNRMGDGNSAYANRGSFLLTLLPFVCILMFVNKFQY